MSALDNPIPATLYVTSEPQTPGAAVGLFDADSLHVHDIFTRCADGFWENEDHVSYTWDEIQRDAGLGSWDIRAVERAVTR